VIKWKHPLESRQVVGFLKGLDCTTLEVAMEPSGSYGDPLRSLFWASEIPVYRVSPKRSHDAAEVFDGVPSSHDAKSAGIVAKLHIDGASDLWEIRSEADRDLRAAVDTLDFFHTQRQRNLGRLESRMARYWPEVGGALDYSSATFLELIARYGGPRQVGERAEEARAMMRKVGRGFLQEEKIESVLASCRDTIGMRMTGEEEEALKQLAAHTRQVCKQLREAQRHVERMSLGRQSVQAMGSVLGKITSAVLVSEGGDPERYLSGSQWVKSLGLNLKERSSGKYEGKLKITKRGSGKARRWLYLAALRLIKTDMVVRAWYQAKVMRDGGVKKKAIVAIMRKLVRALWHVAQGDPFDSRKMFDVKRLGFSTS